MASMNSLLISWNFDTVTESDNAGNFDVLDVSNTYHGTGHNFETNSKVASKEFIITNKKMQIETLDASQTISIEDEDDLRINEKDPVSVKLLIENSMYQIISDEILNIFSTINDYSFKFTESRNKYLETYKKLDATRHEYFSKVLEKPNIEKYIEFYKWLDSSLGYMLDQLKPENSNSVSGLKTTIESHILERNKYKHQLPLLINEKNIFTSGITSIKKVKGAAVNSSSFDDRESRDSDMVYTTSSLDVGSIQNIFDKNYKKNYEFFQTAGKKINHRNGKVGKSIFLTRYSSVDGWSDKFKDISGEYSVYNDTNQRAQSQRHDFNVTSSLPLETQGANTYITSASISYQTDFEDNTFIQRNIPYTASHYVSEKLLEKGKISTNYQTLPSKEVEFRHYTNILLDVNKHFRPSETINESGYRLSSDMVEPPIQFNSPLKQNLQVKDAFEQLTIYSPYSSFLDNFSYRNILRDNKIIFKFTDNLQIISDKNTFYKKTISNNSLIDFYYLEKLEPMFPRTDLVGLARIRTKATRYEEERGYFQPQFSQSNVIPTRHIGKHYLGESSYIEPWSNNSYNINSSRIRSFWRSSFEKRKRTRGVDQENPEIGLTEIVKTGSYNCLNFPNRLENLPNFIGNDFISASYEGNIYNSIYSMDANVDYTIVPMEDPYGVSSQLYFSYQLTGSGEVYGDLAPYSHFMQAKNLYWPTTNVIQIFAQPKPTFIHNIFPGRNLILTNDTLQRDFYDDPLVLNKSYQDGLDCKIKPFYDTYDDFRQDIKHRSQDMSIIPEFIVSNFETLIDSNNDYLDIAKQQFQSIYARAYGGRTATKYVDGYLTIYGNERYDQINHEDFYCDFKKFIDRKSNKIKINVKGVKKLLPYNGFYPQQRTQQIAGIFQNSYMINTGIVTELSQSAGPSMYSGIRRVFAEPVRRFDTLAMLQPLFMPGILFNTIKAGLGVSWPVAAFKEGNRELDRNCYLQWDYPYFFSPNNKDVGVRYLTHNLPFETILQPYKHYAEMHENIKNNYPIIEDGYYDASVLYDKYNNFDLDDYSNATSFIYLPYLDPTHYGLFPKLNGLNSVAGTNLSRNLQKWREDKFLYVSAINNFLAETVHFFLENEELTYFRSAPASSFGPVTSGVTYAMDIIIKKSENFSMFNNYSSLENVYVPFDSLFGPPVLNTSSVEVGPFVDVSKGYIFSGKDERDINVANGVEESAYKPYAPPYFYSNTNRLTVTYTPENDFEKASISDIILRAKVLAPGQTYPASPPTTSEANEKRMTLKDCLKTNILRVFKDKEYDPSTGKPINDQINNDDICMVIQPKMETPLLNFKKCSKVEVSEKVIAIINGTFVNRS